MSNRRHLLGIAQLTREDIVHILDSAERWFDLPRDAVKTARVLHGRTVVNLFFESSTRTRTSFEVAGKRLGADVVNVSPQTSSVTKGETLLDTVRNLEALRADAIVLRHPASGALRLRGAGDAGVDRQRRRRRPRAPDAGAPRRVHDAASQGPGRGPRRRHLRRHPALARRAFERASARRARGRGAPLRSADALAARASSLSARR